MTILDPKPQTVAGLDAAVTAKATTDGTALKAALSAAYGRRVNAALRGLRTPLDAGLTCAIGWQGDSTGDAPADGSGDRLAKKLATKVAARYPNHHVLFKQWSDAAQDFAEWDTIQDRGRRYMTLTNAPIEYIPSGATDFASGKMDLQVLVKPNSWASGAYQVLAARMYDASLAAKPQFAFHLKGDGKLNISYSTNGTAINQGFDSTAAVAGGADPQWLRCTVEITAGASITVNFFTSPYYNRNNWTQLGTTVSFADAGVQALSPQPTAMFQLGGKGRTIDPFAGNIYEVQIRDGVSGRCIAPCCPTLYTPYPNGASTAIPGGAPTLYFLNGSRSGADLTHLSDATRMPKMTPDYGQRAQFFNTSHNDGNASPYIWSGPYKAWVDAVLARLPLASAVLVGQSPHDPARWTLETSQGSAYRMRVMAVAALASTNAWGYLDLYNGFLESGQTLAALVSADGLHPTPAGYELGGTLADSMLGIA